MNKFNSLAALRASALMIAVVSSLALAGPLQPDGALSKAYDNAAKAMLTGTDNPIVQWTYRIWCVTGYRTARAYGVNGVDNLIDPEVDLVTPLGYTVGPGGFAAMPYPDGGMKFLDNAWVFGSRGTALVIVRTPSGKLLMFDALGSTADFTSQVINQVAAAGLDLRNVSHVFIGHSHADHYAGVNLVKQFAPNAVVVAGAPDATIIATARTTAENATYTGTPAEQSAAKAARLLAIPAKVDVTVPAAPPQEQGVKRLQLEPNVEAVAMLVPGHTPGAIQVIVPVVHKGKTEKLLVWSGNDAPVAATEQYGTGARVVEQNVVKEQVSAWINTHTYQGAVFGHLLKLKADPNAPNPILMGNDNVRRLLSVFSTCHRALAQRFRDGTWTGL